MKIRDAYILARTKRRTRRIRTALVVGASALLFALLFFGVFVAAGLENTVRQVKNAGFNGRYLTEVSPNDSANIQAPDVPAIQKQMDKELHARGVKVGKATHKQADYLAELSRRIQAELVRKQQRINTGLEQWVKSHTQPTGIYHLNTLSALEGAQYQATDKDDPLVAQLKKDAESGVAQSGYFLAPEQGLGFKSVEQEMLRTQLQPGQSFAWQPGQPYPLVVSYTYLEKLTGRSLTNLSVDARNQGYRQLIKDYIGKVVQYCYRNETAYAQLQEAVTYNYTATTDKDNATKPVSIPVCRPLDAATVKKVQSANATDNSPEKPLFKQPKTPLPVTRVLQFRLVGFVPSSAGDMGNDFVAKALSGLTEWNTPYPGLIPSEVVAREDLLQSRNTDTFFPETSRLFVDFSSRSAQKVFIGQGCKGGACSTGVTPHIAPFGNVNVALEGIFRTGLRFLLAGVAVIMVIAIALAMFTISKVISDSSKEIAVFRALGARRRDIAGMYVTYGYMLAASMLVLALALGVAGSVVLTQMLGAKAAAAFVAATGAYEIDVHANLTGWRTDWVAAVVAGLLLSVTLGMCAPILFALRRKLINALREE